MQYLGQADCESDTQKKLYKNKYKRLKIFMEFSLQFFTTAAVSCVEVDIAHP